MKPVQALNLERYFQRIGYEGAREPTLAVLVALHSAHLAHVPFENIDVYQGRRVSLDLGALEEKLLGSQRGGYCFEQNTLFAVALRRLGFAVDTLEARVRPPCETEPLARTHMTLRVFLEQFSCLTDVGFGADGPLQPVPFDGRVSEQFDGAYRIGTEPDEIHVLQRRWRGEWRDLYAFKTDPTLPIDFIVANHYTSTHPESIFVRTQTVHLSQPEVRHILRGNSYTVRHGDEEIECKVSEEELPELLRDVFGLYLP